MGNATRKTAAAPGLLTPVRGSNPDRHPVPSSGLLEFFRGQGVVHPELCYITSLAVHHAVSIYSCASSDPRADRLTRDFFGFSGPAFQVMRWDESTGPGKEFWNWYLWERPQWYPTPEAACAAYVAGYHQWVKNHPEGS
jgi:hypothetical protein